jgi:hypothetical protein
LKTKSKCPQASDFGYQCQALRDHQPNVVWRSGARKAHWKLAHG